MDRASNRTKFLPLLLALAALLHFIVPCSFASQTQSLTEEAIPIQSHNGHGCFLDQKSSEKKMNSADHEGFKKLEEINKFVGSLFTTVQLLFPKSAIQTLANFQPEMFNSIRSHFLFASVRTTVLLT